MKLMKMLPIIFLSASLYFIIISCINLSTVSLYHKARNKYMDAMMHNQSHDYELAKNDIREGKIIEAKAESRREFTEKIWIGTLFKSSSK